jgi:hypothetical protein
MAIQPDGRQMVVDDKRIHNYLRGMKNLFAAPNRGK